jgi:hypothetical protein
MRVLRRALTALVVLSLTVSGLVLVNTPNALAADYVNCNSPQTTHPVNSWQCPLASYHTGDVFLTSYPEQNEITCTDIYPHPLATIQVVILARRTATGFLIKGLWLRLDVGIVQLGWFASQAIDGNDRSVVNTINGTNWSYFNSPYGNYNPDVAVRGDHNDITRNPRLTSTNPIWLAWGAHGSAYMKFVLHEQAGNTLFNPTAGCVVQPFYVTIIPR